jgi:protein-tyrosine phosphatase
MKGAAFPPPASLGLRGARNFRDLGGYAARGGRRVRRGLLFRSNHLAGLTHDDKQVLARLGLRAVCDLRGLVERERPPNPMLAGVRLMACGIEPAVVPRLRARQAAGDPLDARAAQAIVTDVYREYVRTWFGAYRALFEVLLAGEVPLVFHCSAGKDRTGVAAALVLSALGVPRATVRHDYMLSRLFWREPPGAHLDFPAEVMSVAGSVDLRFLDAAFGVIDREYHGMARYLQAQLGVGPGERRQLAALYLESGAPI